MATLVELVNPSNSFGGIRDGYRRGQLGQPTGTVGQPPAFRGRKIEPGGQVEAPKILSSAARQSRGTNVTIPYPRVAPADELANIGRVAPGDLLFIHRNKLSATSHVRMSHSAEMLTTASATAHANTHRVSGLDAVNRGLRRYQAGRTVLVNSTNPADDWRKLTYLNDWTLDGIVIGDDSPGFFLDSTAEAGADRIFNVGIQGVCNVNNGYGVLRLSAHTP